jgi:hypothetical protein
MCLTIQPSMQRLTDEELLGAGYFRVPSDMWGRLRYGDIIKYVRSVAPEKTYGGRITGIFEIDGVPNFKIHAERSSAEWCEKLAGVSEIWKKYAPGCEIEFSMIMISLSEKNKRLEEANARIRELRMSIMEVNDRLRELSSSLVIPK